MIDSPIRAMFLWTLMVGGCRGFYDPASSSGASGTTSSPTTSSSSDPSSDGSTSSAATNTETETTGDTGAPASATPTGRTGSTADTGSIDPLCGPTDPEPVEGPLLVDVLMVSGPGEEEFTRDHEAGILTCEAELAALQATFERPVAFPEVDWSQQSLMFALHAFNVTGGPMCIESPRSLEVEAGVVVLGVAKEADPNGLGCNDAGTVVTFVALVPRAAYDGARIEVLPDYPAEE